MALAGILAACTAAPPQSSTATAPVQMGRGVWVDCVEMAEVALRRQGWSGVGVRRCDAVVDWLLLLSNDRAVYPMISWMGLVWSTVDVTERHMPPGEVPDVTRHEYAWARSGDGRSVVLAYVVDATVLEGDPHQSSRAFVVAVTPGGACLIGSPERRQSMTAEAALAEVGMPSSCPSGAEPLTIFPAR